MSCGAGENSRPRQKWPARPSALEVGSTGPCGGGASPSPDACRVDAPRLNPAAQSAGAFSQVFSFAEIPSGTAAGFVSVLAPVGAALIGLRKGEEIDWPVPGGKLRRLRVTDVRHAGAGAGS